MRCLLLCIVRCLYDTTNTIPCGVCSVEKGVCGIQPHINNLIHIQYLIHSNNLPHTVFSHTHTQVTAQPQLVDVFQELVSPETTNNDLGVCICCVCCIYRVSSMWYMCDIVIACV